MDAAGWVIGALLVAAIIALVLWYPLDQRRRERHWRREIAAQREARLRERLARVQEVLPNQYRCTSCGKVYDKGRDDAEAMAEALAVFGSVLNAEGPPCIVCDDCYRTIMGDDPPRLEPHP